MGKIFNISTYVSLLFFVISFSNSSANNNEKMKLFSTVEEQINVVVIQIEKLENINHNRKQRGGDCPPKRGYSRREVSVTTTIGLAPH